MLADLFNAILLLNLYIYWIWGIGVNRTTDAAPIDGEKEIERDRVTSFEIKNINNNYLYFMMNLCTNKVQWGMK